MRRLTIAVLTALCTLGTPPATSPALGRQGGQPPTPEPLVSIDFKGGTVSQYIEALKKSVKAVNVVSSERASKQQLAPVSLSQVSVGVAVYSIQAAATSGSGNWRIDRIAPPGPAFPGMNIGGDAFSVDFYPYGKRGEDVVVESYSLQRIIKAEGKAEGLDPRIVLTAIETGLRLQNEGVEQPPDLQFHADSGLLFVRGSNSDVRLVGSVVARMTDDAKARASAAEKRARDQAIQGVKIKEAALDIELREVELAAAQRNAEHLRPLIEKGMASSADGVRMEAELAKARINLERAKLGLEKARIGPADSPLGDWGGEEEVEPASAPVTSPGRAAPAGSTKRPTGK